MRHFNYLKKMYMPRFNAPNRKAVNAEYEMLWGKLFPPNFFYKEQFLLSLGKVFAKFFLAFYSLKPDLTFSFSFSSSSS